MWGQRGENTARYSAPGEIRTHNLLIRRSASEEFDDAFDENFDKEFENFDAEFRELEKQSAQFPKLIVAIFLGVAGIMLAIAAFSGINALRTQSREQSAPGKVVDLVVRRTRDSSTQEIREYTYPVVEFVLPGGTLQSVEISEGSSPPAYAIGDQVTVLYTRSSPAMPGLNPLPARCSCGCYPQSLPC